MATVHRGVNRNARIRENERGGCHVSAKWRNANASANVDSVFQWGILFIRFRFGFSALRAGFAEWIIKIAMKNRTEWLEMKISDVPSARTVVKKTEWSRECYFLGCNSARVKFAISYPIPVVKPMRLKLLSYESTISDLINFSSTLHACSYKYLDNPIEASLVVLLKFLLNSLETLGYGIEQRTSILLLRIYAKEYNFRI